jgi:hypothetical protein
VTLDFGVGWGGWGDSLLSFSGRSSRWHATSCLFYYVSREKKKVLCPFLTSGLRVFSLGLVFFFPSHFLGHPLSVELPTLSVDFFGARFSSQFSFLIVGADALV